MNGMVKRTMQLAVIWLICLGLFNPQPAWAASNISSTYKYAWSESAGWQNWRSTNAQARVGWTYLVGYVWAENIGWIKLGSTPSGGTYPNTTSTNWGVNHNSATGALSGYGWSENVGWVNFNPTHSQVTIDTTTLKFDGYAWAENVGYVHFQNAIPEYYVQQNNPRTLLAHGTASSFKSSLKNVEMFNGTSWVSLFTGAAQLDMVPGGTFPGISNHSLPAGTYSQIRVTFYNSFPVTGTLSYSGTT